MTDQPETPPPAAEPEGGGTLDQRMSRVESAIDQIRAVLTGGSGHAPGSATSEGDSAQAADAASADATRQAVAEIRRREAAKKRRAAEAGRLDRVEAAVQAIAEKPPREYRKATRFMRWEDEADK